MRELLKQIVREEIAYVGTVVKVDEDKLTVDVKLERKEQILRELPIRVMNTSDDFGIYVIPKVGTDVLVVMVDERPSPVAFQEWEKIVLKRGDGFSLIVEKSGDIALNHPQGTRVSVRGNEVSISAEQVKIGQNAVGGVITDKTLPACIFSGAPMVNFSSKTVKASS